MSRPDSLKEEIGWLKAFCGFLLAGEASLLAWLVQNYAARHVLLFPAIAVVFGHDGDRRCDWSHLSLHQKIGGVMKEWGLVVLFFCVAASFLLMGLPSVWLARDERRAKAREAAESK
jgi:hypothetical protein